MDGAPDFSVAQEASSASSTVLFSVPSFHGLFTLSQNDRSRLNTTDGAKAFCSSILFKLLESAHRGAR